MTAGTEYLLPFMRTAKFSQLRARELLEGYLKLVGEQANWYKQLDPCEELQEDVLKAGYVHVRTYVRTHTRTSMRVADGDMSGCRLFFVRFTITHPFSP